MTVFTVRHPVLSTQGKTCLTVVEIGRMPGELTVALVAVDCAELIKMRVTVTLAAVAFDAPVDPFSLVTVCAKQIMVNTFEIKACF